MEMPRGRYRFGPLIVCVDLIEPFIMSNCRIGLSFDDMHNVTFDSMEQMSEFINMLDMYQDCYSKENYDYKELKQSVASKCIRDSIERKTEYQQTDDDYNHATSGSLMIFIVLAIVFCIFMFQVIF